MRKTSPAAACSDGSFPLVGIGASAGGLEAATQRLRNLAEEILPRNSSFDDLEVEHNFPHLGRRTMVFNARRLASDGEGHELVLLAIEPRADNKPQ